MSTPPPPVPRRIVHGIATSPGLALGPVHVVRGGKHEIPSWSVAGEDVEREIERLHAALEAAAREMKRRQELVKVAHKYAEAARVAVRHVRRDGIDVIKKLEKDHQISKDDHDRYSTEIQKATDQSIHDIDQMLAHKEKEILTV